MPLRTIFIVTLELLLFMPYASASELTEMMQSALQTPKRLSSYQFTVVFQGSAINEKDSVTPQIIQFSQSGDLFIVDGQIYDARVAANSDPLVQHTIYAYNGSKYQWYVVGRDAVTFSENCQHPNLYYFPNPLMLPYYWLISEQSNWSDIKDEKIWKERFDEVTDEDQITLNDYICDVIKLPDHSGMYTTNYVYFAKDSGSYPVRIKLIKDLSFALIDVDQYSTIHTETGDVVFPLNVSLTIVDNGQEQVRLKWSILPESIQANPVLDDKIFTISTENVGTVVDYNEVLKQVGTETESIPLLFTPPRRSIRSLLTILGSLLVIGSIVVSLVSKDRRTKNANKS